MGFDSKVKKCAKGCEYSKDRKIDGKIKTHPISVLQAFEEIKKTKNVEEITGEEWFEKSKQIHKEKFGGFNDKGFNPNHLKSLLEFYCAGKIELLQKLVAENNFKKAFYLVKDEIKGIGHKVAKFIIRDLIFLLTEWGKDEKIYRIYSKEELVYALPVDIWVRRIALSIPIIGDKVMESLKKTDLVDKVDDKIDEKISMVIAEKCCEMGLNPLLFDFGAYLFGRNKIKRKESIDEIYKILTG